MARSFWPAGLMLAALAGCVPVARDAASLAVPAPLQASGGGESYYWGTGFFVDRGGQILTAHHLVRNCARIEVVAKGRREVASLVASSATDDLSLLSIPDMFGTPLRFAPSDAPRGGALVAVLGYAALGGANRLVAANSMVIAGATPRHIALISDARPGFSGSPVVAPDGFVVGVLESKLTQGRSLAASGRVQEIRLAVSAAAAREFLRAQNLAADDDPPARFASLFDRLDAAEVKVECHGDAPQSALEVSQLP